MMFDCVSPFMYIPFVTHVWVCIGRQVDICAGKNLGRSGCIVMLIEKRPLWTLAQRLRMSI